MYLGVSARWKELQVRASGRWRELYRGISDRWRELQLEKSGRLKKLFWGELGR